MEEIMGKVLISLKPVSTNNLYGGKRYKKKGAVEFEGAVEWVLKYNTLGIKIPESGDLELITRFYVSRKFDTSNCLKLFEDCLALHFKINDRRFAGHRMSRVVVKEGQEKIEFKINHYDDSIYKL